MTLTCSLDKRTQLLDKIVIDVKMMSCLALLKPHVSLIIENPRYMMLAIDEEALSITKTLRLP